MASNRINWRHILSLVILAVMTLSVTPPSNARAERLAQEGLTPTIIYPDRTGISLPPAEQPSRPAPLTPASGDDVREVPRRVIPRPAGSGDTPAPERPGLVPLIPQGGPSMPSPLSTWEGISNFDNATVNSFFVLPPDANGDFGVNQLGDTYYFQAVNNLYNVWNEAGTQLLTGPKQISDLFTGFGGMCESTDHGDPIVLYDHLADRWLISQFALDDVGPSYGFHQCIAISSTQDPVADPWYLYDFLVSTTKLNDYPKFGVWPDGYYLTFNQFDGPPAFITWAGQGIAVLEREEMLVGNSSARMVYFDLEVSQPGLGGMLPADLDGSPPPVDTPGYFVQVDDDSWGYPDDQLQIWALDANWSGNTWAFGPVDTSVSVTDFDADLCNYNRDCIPQPGAAADQYLDAISDRLMYRLQYRYQGGAEHMVVNHTVDVGSDHAGIRWYHLENNGSGWAVAEQGDYAPDSDHRWMGSAAMDASGNIAVGYSVSSGTTYPSIRYAGRLSTDTAGQLAQGEATVVSGGGIQTNTLSRWGDYSMLAVDPSDQCTFWYTTEYIATTGEWTATAPWRTKIASFNFGSGTCTTPNTYTISGVVTNDASGLPISGASVKTDTGFLTITDADGTYTLDNLPAGTVTVTAEATGYLSSSQGVTMPPDAVNVDFALISSTADIDLYFGASLMGNYTIDSGMYTPVSFPGVYGGPVRVDSTGGAPIIATERVIHYYGGVNTSYYEMTGLPVEQLSTEYWYPYYTNAGVNTQLRFANVGVTDATVQVYIAGNPVGSLYTIAPNTLGAANFYGTVGGPVRVVSTNGVPIISTERFIFTTNGVTPSSFAETMGMPLEQLSTEYWFPFYNNVSLNSQLRFANAGATDATVQIHVAGSQVGPTYTLTPNSTQFVSLAGVAAGPVRVVSTNGVPIIATERVIHYYGGVNTSYYEMMGLPVEQLSTEYWYPYYTNAGVNTQLRFANVGVTDATVQVYIAGNPVGSLYTIAPNTLGAANFYGTVGGPVQVVSTNGVPIISTERFIFTTNGVTPSSFAETMGMPLEQLSAEYWFPFYNNASLNSQLRFATP